MQYTLKNYILFMNIFIYTPFTTLSGLELDFHKKPNHLLNVAVMSVCQRTGMKRCFLHQATQWRDMHNRGCSEAEPTEKKHTG